MYVCPCLYLCTCVCMYVCVHVCMYVCACLYVCTCVRMYACMYARAFTYLKVNKCPSDFQQHIKTHSITPLKPAPTQSSPTHSIALQCVSVFGLRALLHVSVVHLVVSNIAGILHSISSAYYGIRSYFKSFVSAKTTIQSTAKSNKTKKHKLE